MKSLIKNNKGLSPVIATVLLILLVITLASIVFLWARGFISEQVEKFDKPIETLCSSVKFEVQKGSSSDELEISNLGDVDIFKFEIKLFDGEGNSESKYFEINVPKLSSAKGRVDFTLSDRTLAKKVIVYPVLIGNVKGKDSNRLFTCVDRGKTVG